MNNKKKIVTIVDLGCPEWIKEIYFRGLVPLSSFFIRLGGLLALIKKEKREFPFLFLFFTYSSSKNIF